MAATLDQDDGMTTVAGDPDIMDMEGGGGEGEGAGAATARHSSRHVWVLVGGRTVSRGTWPRRVNITTVVITKHTSRGKGGGGYIIVGYPQK